jgi:hypothetical protein
MDIAGVMANYCLKDYGRILYPRFLLAHGKHLESRQLGMLFLFGHFIVFMYTKMFMVG